MGLLYGAFSGGKGGRCVRLTTLPPSCAVVTKSGNLNFLETSGPVQACNRNDLPFSSSNLHSVAMYSTLTDNNNIVHFDIKNCKSIELVECVLDVINTVVKGSVLLSLM